MKFPELDLAILKVIFENKKAAIEFASEGDSKLFSADLWKFVSIVIECVKIYKELPTKKVLIDVFAKNETQKKYIESVCEALQSIELNDKEFKHNLKILKDRYAKNLLTSVSLPKENETEEVDIQKTVQSLLNVTERVRGLYKTKSFNQKTVKESVDEFAKKYRAKSIDPNFGRGILTGYNFIDFQTNGLRPQELFLVAGESGTGKSTLLMNIAIQMWLQNNKVEDLLTVKDPKDFKKGYNIVFFSLEMPHEQCFNRLLSRVADVPYRGIRDGNLKNDEQIKKMEAALKFMKRYPFEFEIIDMPRGATIEAIELALNDIKLKYEPDVVVIDYLGLMSLNQEVDQDWLKFDIIAGQIHELGRVMNLCMLSAVQLNRLGKGKDSGEAIGLHRISRSAGIATHANIIMQMEKRPDENQHPDCILHFIKNRDGEMIKGRLLKNFAHCSLTNDYGDVPTEVVDTEDIAERLKSLENIKDDEN